MLVLTRKVGERIVIAGSIVVEVLEVGHNRVRVGIQAPPGTTILRQELLSAGRGSGLNFTVHSSQVSVGARAGPTHLLKPAN
jgi:carbon storage regulator